MTMRRTDGKGPLGGWRLPYILVGGKMRGRMACGGGGVGKEVTGNGDGWQGRLGGLRFQSPILDQIWSWDSRSRICS